MAKKKNNKSKSNKKKPLVPKQVPIEKTINSDAIAAALSSIRPPVLLKVCRLCEAKDGPFLNIFDAERVTAKKIENVMPFVILENDDLPHKICFRCSAKVEELYEFIQKCIKTQENLGKAMGKSEPLVTKVKTRTLWEEKLNKSNITNEDICNALIKKAMEGIKDQLPRTPPTNTTVSNTETKNDTISKDTYSKGNSKLKEEVIKQEEITETPQKAGISQERKCKNTRSKATINEEETSDNNMEPKKKVSKSDIKKTSTAEKTSTTEKKSDEEVVDDKQKPSQAIKEEPVEKEKPPFNIMDHVSMIKVNGVGVLFQCKLCNRNFLKKEVVMSHGCAKNGTAKKEAFKETPPPEPPKQPTVKYITTKPESELKKPVVIEGTITLDDDDDDDDMPLLVRKTKPKVGPASKVKKAESVTAPIPVLPSNTIPQSFSLQVAPSNNIPGQASVVQIPNLPSLNSRYKLVPGPNNTFTLVEEPSQNQTPVVETPATMPRPELPAAELSKQDNEILTNKLRVSHKKSSLEERPPETSSQPYPVGLFQTMAHNPNILNTSVLSGPTSFPTPAMKKQSYTVVQTGNPSKLLISSKAQQPEEEVPKKRQKRARTEIKDDQQKQPYAVTLEDVAPPRDPGFFTFINVDPLLQPSYVLPTNNIIQESQISTSTNVVKNTKDNATKDKDLKYTCNICQEKFNREKKLLTHIQLHYKMIDEEDKMRTDSKIPKKRGRQSLK